MASPLKVAMVAACPLPCPRGTPVRIARMAEALARRGHEVHVVTYHLGDGDLGDGVRVHRIPDIPTYRKLSPGPTCQKLLVLDTLLVRELRRVIRSQKFDLIHAHHVEGLLVGAAVRRSTGPPLIFDAHTLLASELPHYPLLLPSALVGWVGEWLDRRLPPMADHVISVTENIRDRLIRSGGLPGHGVTVIGNGVESEKFDPTPSSGVADHDREKTITFAGNLAPYQGIGFLLRAIAILRARGEVVRVVLVTETEDRLTGHHANLARALSIEGCVNVVRADFNELPRWLQRSDVLVHPRPACDGLPLKLLNYMAAGRPIVSFADSAVGLVHGESGWLVPDGSAEELAVGIQTVLGQPELAAHLGAGARQAALDRFSWNALAAQVEDVYRMVVQAAPARRVPASS